MTQIPSVNPSAAGQSQSATNSLNQLDLDSFLKLMIVELQNQDPLNPLDNKDMLAQISQLRSVAATDQLTQTLDSVLLGQNIASATNLIGAEVSAISDDGQRAEGVVERVSIAGGRPRLHLVQPVKATPSGEEGNVGPGTYSYRVVWHDEEGKVFGLELSGANAVTTTGLGGLDSAIRLNNLPATGSAKHIYRTDSSGEGSYQLVGVLTDGSQATFLDRLGDDERSTPQTQPFERSSKSLRQYEVSLRNISDIRPPSQF